MTYDILLEGCKGERLVDFAASDEAKDYKVKRYIKSIGWQYGVYKVIVRNRKTNEIIEEHSLDK